MDVSCSRCGAEYEFEETLVSDRGTTVKCTSCGHLFKVFRPDQTPGTTEESKPWLIKRTNGSVEPLVSLGDLTRLNAPGGYTAEDEISRTGQVWKRLGDIAELRGFISASRRLPSQKGDTLLLGAKLPGAQETEAELPAGIVSHPQPQSGRTDPSPPLAPGETETKPKARKRQDTPSMWGATQEPESAPEEGARTARPVAPLEALSRAESALVSDIRPGEEAQGAQRDTEKGFVAEETDRDSDQQIPTTKVKPIGAESSDAALRWAEKEHEPGSREKRAAPGASEAETGKAFPARIPLLLDDSDEAPRIPRSRTGRLIWVLPVLLAIGLGWLAWSMLRVEKEEVGPAVTDRAERFVKRGKEALASHRVDRFSESITEFTKALAFREDDPRLLGHLSHAYAVWAQSLGFRIRDVESSATGDTNTESAALRHERQNYAARAMQYAERAVRHGPNSGEAMLALADAARLNGDLAKARSSLAKTRSLPLSDSAELLRVEAMMAIDSAEGDLKAGRVLAEKAVEMAPESVGARLLLARCLMAAEEREGALSQLEFILSRDPEHPATISLKQAWKSATAAEQVEEPEKEEPEPSEVESDDKTTGKAGKERKEQRGGGASTSGLADLIRRGEKLLESGAVGRAEQVFRRALQMKPNDPRALTGMGYVEIEKNRAAGAIRYFQPAAGQGYPEAYIGLGDAYRRLGRKTDALRSYEAYVRKRPRGRLASIARAQIEQYRIEMQKKAEQHRQEETKRAPSAPVEPR
jgi:predicted Zn finger-like uncharacterized protein